MFSPDILYIAHKEVLNTGIELGSLDRTAGSHELWLPRDDGHKSVPVSQFIPPGSSSFCPHVRSWVCFSIPALQTASSMPIELGIENGFIQEGETAEESFIPAFDGEGV